MKDKPRRLALVVDDDSNLRDACIESLSRAKYEALGAHDVEEAMKILNCEDVEIAIIDLRLGSRNGLDLMRDIKNISPETEVIIITAYASIDSAVQAIKDGAYDYLAKPFGPDELCIKVDRCLEYKDLKNQNISLRTSLDDRLSISGMIGKSREIQDVVDQIDRVAATDTTVFITGETGVGKELTANLVHRLSPRAQGPFVPLNCSAIPEHLMEEELFGHEKGAFTGAHRQRKGSFEMANGGTLFLDEIGDLRTDLQVVFLRVLEDGMVKRIGSERLHRSNVRIIAATSQDLEQLVEEGKFRSDLYYRLNVFRIKLPPLRRRMGDVSLLSEAFLREFSAKMGKKIHGFEEEAMKFIKMYPWPGNVRELRNIIERAVILCDHECITTSLIEEILPRSERVVQGMGDMKQMEYSLIEKVLKECGGNRTKAAGRLGVSTTTLWRKLKKYRLDSE